MALEANALALINWAACTSPDTCPSVKPGEERAIPFAEIRLYTPAAEAAVVYWWHLRPAGHGTFAPDSIRAVRVALRRAPNARLELTPPVVVKLHL
jgi:hypothetical protein